MKRIWLVKIEWDNGNTTITYRKTREDSRNLKKAFSELSSVSSVKILKGYEYVSGRTYIGGKVHY